METNKTFEELRKEAEEAKNNSIEFNKKLKTGEIQGESNIEYDDCVFCGKITPYPKILGIDQRYCYIEGAGQLCIDCCKKYNDKRLI